MTKAQKVIGFKINKQMLSVFYHKKIKNKNKKALFDMDKAIHGLGGNVPPFLKK